MGGKFYSHSYKVSVEKTRLQCSQHNDKLVVQTHQVRVAESNVARNTDRCASADSQMHLSMVASPSFPVANSSEAVLLAFSPGWYYGAYIQSPTLVLACT